jgi:hypothetical protein
MSVPVPATNLAALRQLLEQRFPDATPVTHRTTEQVASGIAALDHVLPSGGFPRGRLSVWAPQGGATAILRAVCYATTQLGERSAWIDGAHAIAGDSWIPGPILLRPKTRRHGLRAAEELLRSGGVAFVVLAGTDPQGTESVRLTRAAREGGAALVTLTALTTLSSLRLTSSIDPHGYRWRRTPFGDPADVRDVTVRVRARAPGWNARSEFLVPVTHHELRLSLEPGLVDRRGVHDRHVRR